MARLYGDIFPLLLYPVIPCVTKQCCTVLVTIAESLGWADLVLAARGVVQHAGIVGDLVVGQQQEAHVHALYDHSQPGHGRSNAHPHEPILCTRPWSFGDVTHC